MAIPDVKNNTNIPNWLTIQPQQGVGSVTPFSPIGGTSVESGLAGIDSNLSMGRGGSKGTGTYGTDTRIGALENMLAKYSLTNEDGSVYA